MSGLVTLGETLGLVATGPLPHSHTATLGIGGAESNVATGVRRLGIETAWIGRVGDDGWGQRVLRELRAEGVSIAAVVDREAPTAVMFKERVTPRLTRVLYHRTGSAGSRLTPDDIPEDLVRDADLLHLTGITCGLSEPSYAAVLRAIDLAETAGVPVSFDVNHRAAVWAGRDPRPVYRAVAERAAVVFAGTTEAALLTGVGADDHEGLLDGLDGLAPEVVLTLGADGAASVVAGERRRVTAVPADVVDTVGAGDAFVAGYLVELMRDADPETRLATGARCAGSVCEHAGDWEGLPFPADLRSTAPTDPVVR